ncbi:MAG: ribosome-associated translation inhibitor RaiA, partial [Clostridia bacterium]|nr:ribosome-associated translation inhibitor RaiA [Clostridia bacterium]
EVTDDLKVLIEKKLRRFDKFFGDEAQATVTLKKTKRKEIAEVTISYKGVLYRSEVEEDTFQNALDRTMDHIERQIRKNKTRLAKRLRENAFEKAPEDEPIEEEGEFKIRVKEFSVKPTSVEEAILQMNLLGHDFYIFEDSSSGQVSVVYRRHEDEYGLIVTKKD